MSDTNQVSAKGKESDSGPKIAKVMSHQDSTYSGILTVQILRKAGGTGGSGQTVQAKYLSPFYGAQSPDHVGKAPNDYNQTQKSYGMWMVPPDVGTMVMVIQADGPKGMEWYWIGCVQHENMNFMVPGVAATENVVEGGGRFPVGEYNKEINNTPSDPTKIKKPKHKYLAQAIESQGLIKDDIRGLTTSSARRETPSSVFGISTPGPVDKTSGAKKGALGKEDSKIPNAYVSRLGGSTFVMDDGDDKFVRKTKASEGPPLYASAEQGDTSGDPMIPHNELIRIRTRTGHQILLHNSEDLIYITNSRGTAWIELTSNGKIDVYSKDSISVHTEQDINFTADRDINFTAGANVNINAATNVNQQAGSAFNLKTGAASKISAGGNFEVTAGGTAIDGGNIDLNSGKATAAGTASKAGRIPQTEPWAGHENLDPVNFNPDNTKATENPTAPSPAAFQVYTTKTDTFNKVKGA